MKNLNQLFDYVIIGGSKEGLAIFEFLTKINKNVLLVDEKEHPFENSYLGTAVYISYYRGITRVEVKQEGRQNQLLCCLNVILATGTSPYKLGVPLNPKAVITNVAYNKIPDLSKFNKEICIVVGDSNEALHDTIKLSESFDRVFLCKPNFSTKAKPALNKINEIANIIVFNGDSIVQVEGNSNQITKVILKSYAELPCDLIISYAGKYPETSTFTTQLIKIDSEKYCEVDENYCSTVMKNVYAIGAIVRDYKKTKFINYLKEKHEVN